MGVCHSSGQGALWQRAGQQLHQHLSVLIPSCHHFTAFTVLHFQQLSFCFCIKNKSVLSIGDVPQAICIARQIANLSSLQNFWPLPQILVHSASLIFWSKSSSHSPWILSSLYPLIQQIPEYVCEIEPLAQLESTGERRPHCSECFLMIRCFVRNGTWIAHWEKEALPILSEMQNATY